MVSYYDLKVSSRNFLHYSHALYREKIEKILQEKKDYIEGKAPGGATLYWIDRTIKLGGETDAEKTFRTFEAVRQGIDVIDLNAAGTPPADAPPIQAKQVGGPITIPGSSFGDRVVR